MTSTSHASANQTDEPWLWDTGSYEPTGEILLPYGREIVRRAAPQPGEHALDVGTGNLALLCAETGARTTGVDLARRLLGVARGREAQRRVTWLVGDAQNLPLLDGDVDVAVSCSALVLVPDAPRSARELVRVLRPGGRAVIGGWDWEKQPAFPAEATQAMADAVGSAGGQRMLDEDPGWFAPGRVERLFADLPVDVTLDTMTYPMGSADRVEDLVESFFGQHPVAVDARQRLGDDAWQKVWDAMFEFLGSTATTTDDGKVTLQQQALIVSLHRH